MPAQEPVVWRCQTAWSLEDDFHVYITTLADVLGMLTEGRLQLEILPAGKVVPTDALAEAVSGGRLDACHRTLTLDSLRQPSIGLWGSGPAFGMDALTLLSWHRYLLENPVLHRVRSPISARHDASTRGRSRRGSTRGHHR